MVSLAPASLTRALLKRSPGALRTGLDLGRSRRAMSGDADIQSSLLRSDAGLDAPRPRPLRSHQPARMRPKIPTDACADSPTLIGSSSAVSLASAIVVATQRGCTTYAIVAWRRMSRSSSSNGEAVPRRPEGGYSMTGRTTRCRRAMAPTIWSWLPFRRRLRAAIVSRPKCGVAWGRALFRSTGARSAVSLLLRARRCRYRCRGASVFRVGWRLAPWLGDVRHRY